jgi:hypothetical protein
MQVYPGTMVRIAKKGADIQAEMMTETLSNLKLSLFDRHGNEITSDLYAKVTEVLSERPPTFRVNFTSVSLEAEVFFENLLTSRSHIA